MSIGANCSCGILDVLQTLICTKFFITSRAQILSKLSIPQTFSIEVQTK